MDSLAAELWKHGKVGGSRILDRARDEEESAEFAALVERQARFLYRVGYSVVGNAQDAEGVVRGVFLKLYRAGAWKGVQGERGDRGRGGWRSWGGRVPKRAEG